MDTVGPKRTTTGVADPPPYGHGFMLSDSKSPEHKMYSGLCFVSNFASNISPDYLGLDAVRASLLQNSLLAGLLS